MPPTHILKLCQQQTGYWKGLQDTIRVTINGSRYIAIQYILQYIAILILLNTHIIIHNLRKKKIELKIQLAVYHPGSVIICTSLYIDNLVDKLSQNYSVECVTEHTEIKSLLIVSLNT